MPATLTDDLTFLNTYLLAEEADKDLLSRSIELFKKRANFSPLAAQLNSFLITNENQIARLVTLYEALERENITFFSPMLRKKLVEYFEFHPDDLTEETGFNLPTAVLSNCCKVFWQKQIGFYKDTRKKSLPETWERKLAKNHVQSYIELCFNRAFQAGLIKELANDVLPYVNFADYPFRGFRQFDFTFSIRIELDTEFWYDIELNGPFHTAEQDQIRKQQIELLGDIEVFYFTPSSRPDTPEFDHFVIETVKKVSTSIRSRLAPVLTPPPLQAINTEEPEPKSAFEKIESLLKLDAVSVHRSKLLGIYPERKTPLLIEAFEEVKKFTSADQKRAGFKKLFAFAQTGLEQNEFFWLTATLVASYIHEDTTVTLPHIFSYYLMVNRDFIDHNALGSQLKKRLIALFAAHYPTQPKRVRSSLTAEEWSLVSELFNAEHSGLIDFLLSQLVKQISAYLEKRENRDHGLDSFLEALLPHLSIEYWLQENLHKGSQDSFKKYLHRMLTSQLFLVQHYLDYLKYLNENGWMALDRIKEIIAPHTLSPQETDETATVVEFLSIPTNGSASTSADEEPHAVRTEPTMARIQQVRASIEALKVDFSRSPEEFTPQCLSLNTLKSAVKAQLPEDIGKSRHDNKIDRQIWNKLQELHQKIVNLYNSYHRFQSMLEEQEKTLAGDLSKQSIDALQEKIKNAPSREERVANLRTVEALKNKRQAYFNSIDYIKKELAAIAASYHKSIDAYAQIADSTQTSEDVANPTITALATEIYCQLSQQVLELRRPAACLSEPPLPFSAAHFFQIFEEWDQIPQKNQAHWKATWKKIKACLQQDKDAAIQCFLQLIFEKKLHERGKKGLVLNFNPHDYQAFFYKLLKYSLRHGLAEYWISYFRNLFGSTEKHRLQQRNLIELCTQKETIYLIKDNRTKIFSYVARLIQNESPSLLFDFFLLLTNLPAVLQINLPLAGQTAFMWDASENYSLAVFSLLKDLHDEQESLRQEGRDVLSLTQQLLKDLFCHCHLYPADSAIIQKSLINLYKTHHWQAIILPNLNLERFEELTHSMQWMTGPEISNMWISLLPIARRNPDYFEVYKQKFLNHLNVESLTNSIFLLTELFSVDTNSLSELLRQNYAQSLTAVLNQKPTLATKKLRALLKELDPEIAADELKQPWLGFTLVVSNSGREQIIKLPDLLAATKRKYLAKIPDCDELILSLIMFWVTYNPTYNATSNERISIVRTSELKNKNRMGFFQASTSSTLREQEEAFIDQWVDKFLHIALSASSCITMVSDACRQTMLKSTEPLNQHYFDIEEVIDHTLTNLAQYLHSSFIILRNEDTCLYHGKILTLLNDEEYLEAVKGKTTGCTRALQFLSCMRQLTGKLFGTSYHFSIYDANNPDCEHTPPAIEQFPSSRVKNLLACSAWCLSSDWCVIFGGLPSPYQLPTKSFQGFHPGF